MLDNIQAFLDVHKAGTFSAAAKLHNVAVSSVSRQVDALEQSLGVALFQRSSRRLLLTDAGEQFLPRAQLIVSEMVDAKAALLDAQAEPRGLLSVTAPSVFWRMHIAPTVASFMQQYPLIELDLRLSDHWVDLAEQRADVAIRIGALPDSDLLATRLAPMLRIACASPSYLQAHGRPAAPEDLLHHHCLCLPSTPTGLWTFPEVNQGKPLAVQGRFRSNDVDSLLDAAAAGLGVAHLVGVQKSGGGRVGEPVSSVGSLVCGRSRERQKPNPRHPRRAAQRPLTLRQGAAVYQPPEAGVWQPAVLGQRGPVKGLSCCTRAALRPMRLHV
jgi:DNA-binding transcriptional LysR family regulator